MSSGNEPTTENPERVREEILLGQRDFWRFFETIKVTIQKALIWGVFFFLLWLLRAFFPLIFLTFVFSFVATTITKALGRVLPKLEWRPRVFIVFGSFLILMVILVQITIPQVKRGTWQLKNMITDLPDEWEEEIDPWLYDHWNFYEKLVTDEKEVPIDEVIDGIYVGGRETPLFVDAAEQAEEEDRAKKEPDPNPDNKDDSKKESNDETSAELTEDPNEEPPKTMIVKERVSFFDVDEVRNWMSDFQLQYLKRLPRFITDVVTAIAAGFSLLFLSTLFSFLIVLDIDTLRKEVAKLEATKLDSFYKETVANIVKFGSVLGKVLEAQAVIALVNAVLTAIGLYFLGIPNVGFLSLCVFVCGFIPVAGVFISSLPICLIGLYQGGPEMLFILIGFICAIHFLEAYVLNPRIMGAALHVNPVLVLIILVIGHHALGVWGLLLGLPICYYFFSQVIKREEREFGLRARFTRRNS